MLTKVKQLASGVFSALQDGTRVPIRQRKAAARLDGKPRRCPKYEVVPGVSDVVVTFTLPGAPLRSTELYWDEELHALSVHASVANVDEEMCASLAFGSDIDGSRGAAVLRGETLSVRLPRRDVDTWTGLPAWSRLSPTGISLPLTLHT